MPLAAKNPAYILFILPQGLQVGRGKEEGEGMRGGRILIAW
jgi:hypothetical protein